MSTDSKRSEVLYKRVTQPHGQGEEVILQVKAIDVDKAFEIFRELKEEMGVE